MTKRKVQFAAEHEEKEYDPNPKTRRFKEGHSLDSDDENEEEEKKEKIEENILHEDDIEGQEDETIRNDEGISVTPFNLKDEMEEGHFDADGNYIKNQNEENIQDNWLDSVDWNKVQDNESKYAKKSKEMEEKEVKVDPLKVKKDMVEIMKPGENVLRALRRLGGNKKPMSSAERWKKKKNKQIEEPEDEKTKLNKENLLKLTGFADTLLQSGNFQIYEKTYEQLQYEIKEKMSQFEDADEDSEDDELEAAFNKSKKVSNDDGKSNDIVQSSVNSDSIQNNDNKASSDILDIDSEVMWIYKIKETDNDVLGPFTNTQMMKWQETGHFNDGVYCRKAGSEGSFYNSKRMDFELYT